MILRERAGELIDEAAGDDQSEGGSNHENHQELALVCCETVLFQADAAQGQECDQPVHDASGNQGTENRLAQDFGLEKGQFDDRVFVVRFIPGQNQGR